MKYIVWFPGPLGGWYLRASRFGAVATGDRARATVFETSQEALAAVRTGNFKRAAKRDARIEVVDSPPPFARMNS